MTQKNESKQTYPFQIIIDKKDILLVMEQACCTREEAITAILDNYGISVTISHPELRLFFPDFFLSPKEFKNI